MVTWSLARDFFPSLKAEFGHFLSDGLVYADQMYGLEKEP